MASPDVAAGRVAVITHADSYVGPSLARVLARTGHRFVLHTQRTGGAQPDGTDVDDMAEELRGLGSQCEVLRGADLTAPEGNEMVVDAAMSTFGRIDAACLVTGLITTGAFLGITTDTWDRQKRTNLDMVFHGLQSFLPPMLSAGSGQIVVFTSATGARPEPKVSIYSATRAGANALVRAVGLEHAASGVTVNAIGTNYMDFPGFRQASGYERDDLRERILSQVPMHRLGGLDELAEFTAVLLDGRSRFQTGQFFSFSGGWSG
jgi:3-oxoacyl-[acyl-carrier protein] reductase